MSAVRPWHCDEDKHDIGGNQHSARHHTRHAHDDEEAGGSKEDYLAYSGMVNKSQEKDSGDYTGDYGARYDYETYTIKDNDGNIRTIINKERNDRE